MMPDADVIIAGAGPGGLMTAITLAHEGARVVVADKRARELVGRPLRVSLEKRIFSEAGIPEPSSSELRGEPVAHEFVSPDRNFKLRVRDLPIITVDLRAFMSRLVDMAENAGVEFLFETTVTGPVIREGRVTGVLGTTADQRLLELSATLTVDASGAQGVLRRNLDESMGVELEIDPADLCSIWRESREIDHEAVMELLSRNRIRPQVNVIRFSFMGPYSMFGVFVDIEDDRVDLTVGLMHDAGYPKARDLARGYVESHHWIGEALRGGGGLIPVRRPLDSFVADGFACVGDAACQAIPQHASGVCSALIGGKILGETAAAALSGGGATVSSLWPYNLRYMSARGAVQANSELYRRFLMSLAIDDISLLFSRGLITEEGIKGSLEGLALELPKSAVFSSALGLWRRPSLIGRLFKLAKDSIRVLDLYAAYPAHYDRAAFRNWRDEVGKIIRRWPAGPESERFEV